MPKPGYDGPLERIDECCWRIPRSYKLGMLVEGRIFADERLVEQIRGDQAPEQVANVAFLPGIQMASLAMPDIHWGYGFCIGGVSATDPAEGGVISPGGVGYDINCGVRLMHTNLMLDDVRPRLNQLMDALFRQIPAGVGTGGPYLFGGKELRRLLAEGAPYLASRGWATPGDIEHTEAGGCLADAEPDQVSQRAMSRGGDQCGTLGSGNHFLEVQVVEEVLDQTAARTMGLAKDGICVMIHSGSRGLGYQVCDDALVMLRKAPAKYGIELPDRQLACAPVHSPEGQAYLGAMRCAANYAWANRQLLMWQTREVFAEFFGRTWEAMQMNLVYDVAHNIAKMEQHEIDGRRRLVCVHRKGATRAFPAGHSELPSHYRQIGQPVIIPGDMGRASWVLAGQARPATAPAG
jgi:tRNA-splicing ligase RtcB